MSQQTFQEVLHAGTADATAVANTTSETSAYPDQTISPSYFREGRVLKLTVQGKLSTTSTPTIIFRLRIGGTGGSTGTLLMLSETLTMGSGVSNVNWRAELEITCRRGGLSTGTLLVTGIIYVHTAAGTILINVVGISGFDAPAEVGSLNLAVDTLLAFTVQWSAASSSNTLTTMMYKLQSLN